jgi:hypothetical protein
MSAPTKKAPPSFPNLEITTKGGPNTIHPKDLVATRDITARTGKSVTFIREFSDTQGALRLQTHSHPGMRGRSHQVPIGVPRTKGDQRSVSPDSRKALSALLPPPKKQ